MLLRKVRFWLLVGPSLILWLTALLEASLAWSRQTQETKLFCHPYLILIPDSIAMQFWYQITGADVVTEQLPPPPPPDTFVTFHIFPATLSTAALQSTRSENTGNIHPAFSLVRKEDQVPPNSKKSINQKKRFPCFSLLAQSALLSALLWDDLEKPVRLDVRMCITVRVNWPPVHLWRPSARQFQQRSIKQSSVSCYTSFVWPLFMWLLPDSWWLKLAKVRPAGHILVDLPGSRSSCWVVMDPLSNFTIPQHSPV